MLRANAVAMPGNEIAHSSCGTVANASNFNGTAVPSGDTIWFNSVMKVSGAGSSPVTIAMTNSSIAIVQKGVTTTLKTPNAYVTIDPGATSPSLSYSSSQKAWIERVPASTSGNVFLNGAAMALSTTLPGGANPVTWTATFSSTSPGVSLQWQWAAAAYTTFSSNNNALGVKPLDDNHYAPYNSDHAGTPENYRSYVTGGARGGGGANYTGSYSGTVAVAACVATPPPSPTPSPKPTPVPTAKPTPTPTAKPTPVPTPKPTPCAQKPKRAKIGH
ncbi:MAG: hypothetical protein JO199_00425 [Candidatus Eremiobacteraeota bacterium]|nr:hypothetical protein [Candidatus Eremiobacteraeota bacterium]